jgi:hypothetical protein
VNPDGVVAESLSDLFPGVSPLASDYVRASSTRGAVPFEFLGRNGQYIAALNGQDAVAGSRSLYAPQYVVGGDSWESTLSIVNLEESAGTVTIKFISDEGTQIGATRSLPISARGKIWITDQKFFADPGSSILQGYLVIEGSGVRLAGSVFFGDPGRRTFASAVPLVSRLDARVVLGQLASDAVYYTGVAILNPGDAAANVFLEVFDRNGTRVASKVETIPAKRRRSLLLTQYFPELAAQDISSGYVKISVAVGSGLASFGLFGTHRGSVLSAIPAQPIP